MCAYRCAQLSYTVLIIIPLILQTIITAQMTSTGGEGGRLQLMASQTKATFMSRHHQPSLSVILCYSVSQQCCTQVCSIIFLINYVMWDVWLTLSFGSGSYGSEIIALIDFCCGVTTTIPAISVVLYLAY